MVNSIEKERFERKSKELSVMDKAKGNKLIAEFMGLEYLGKDVNGFKGYVFDLSGMDNPLCYSNTESMRFHRKWDWLMPVVEKLEKIYNIEIKANIVLIYPKKGEWSEIYFGDTKIDAVWKGCVDIIQWHIK